MPNASSFLSGRCGCVCVCHIIPIWLAAWKGHSYLVLTQGILPHWQSAICLLTCPPFKSNRWGCGPEKCRKTDSRSRQVLTLSGPCALNHVLYQMNRWLCFQSVMELHVICISFKCTSCLFKVKIQNSFEYLYAARWRKIVWSNAQKVCEMIKLSNPVTFSIPFINISILSEIEWKPVGAMLYHPKPKHLSSSSPECPIRANVIAHIIMWGCFVCSMTEQPEWFNYTNQIG